MMDLTTTIPEPELDADDAPLREGEAVVLPAPAGHSVRLRFPSPYEPFLTLDGVRIVEDEGGPTRELLLWLSRRMPALSHALDDKRALLAVVAGKDVLVHDIVTLADGAFLDHGRTRQVLEPARVVLPSYALLGMVSTRGELASRTRGIFAAGTTVEVRVEDAGRVVGRRRFRVGR